MGSVHPLFLLASTLEVFLPSCFGHFAQMAGPGVLLGVEAWSPLGRERDDPTETLGCYFGA